MENITAILNGQEAVFIEMDQHLKHSIFRVRMTKDHDGYYTFQVERMMGRRWEKSYIEANERRKFLELIIRKHLFTLKPIVPELKFNALHIEKLFQEDE